MHTEEAATDAEIVKRYKRGNKGTGKICFYRHHQDLRSCGDHSGRESVGAAGTYCQGNGQAVEAMKMGYLVLDACTNCGTKWPMHATPILSVVFFLTDTGNEPVREWLKTLASEDRKIIGEDIKLVQFRWPLGLPLVRKLEADLWEVRGKIGHGNAARVFFTVKGSQMALLHGFIKKSQKTPLKEMTLARTRKNQWLEGG